MTSRLKLAWSHLARTTRMLVGLPDYASYLAHQRAKHPGREPLTEAQFFHACQQSRYGGGNGRCC
ncbi:YbdD/YjiX family protein [Arenimonas sp. MALMAid1274]|uniref:YbdD/YjiX family protein n=1 Tax=Arenimonas sp. MALMAid1274 TaxID=3411630 RepID=UPI003B9DDFE5